MNFFTVIIVLLLGAGVWRLARFRGPVTPGAPAARDDAPARLLGGRPACWPPSGPSGARRWPASWIRSTAGPNGGGLLPAA